MTDFAKQIEKQGTDWIIRSLMDVDFYKFTMGYYIFKKHKGVSVRFSLINRDKSVPLAKVIDVNELRAQLEHARTLRFTQTDIAYLRGMDVYGDNMFDQEYIEFLKTFQLPAFELETNGEQFSLSFAGAWEYQTFWETIALAIISELYYRSLMRKMTPMEIKVLYAKATDKLYNKLCKIKNHAPGAKIADFGQRRRHSFLWQKFAFEMAQEVLGDSFTGTSNTWLAFNQNLTPIGTNAHELPMVVTALYDDENKKNAQYDIIREWGKLYGEGLRIVLPDTYGSKQFFDGMPEDLKTDIIENWRGIRQDSGNVMAEADNFYKWVKENGVDPSKKVCIFSDGLDGDNIIEYHNAYKDMMITPFGWGTNLTNDFVNCAPNGDPLFKPFSMVCKVTLAGGNRAVKLSNNPSKATGVQSEIDRYKKIFGVDGFENQKVTV